MSDLQCPARILFARTGSAEVLTAAVSGERVSAVWSSPEPDATRTAGRVADSLGLAAHTDGRLAEVSSTESEAAALDRIGRLVAEVADLGRGETSLLISHPELIGLAVGRLPATVAGAELGPAQLPPGLALRVEVDSSGWVCLGTTG